MVSLYTIPDRFTPPATTTRFAVLLPAPAVGVCALVAPLVVVGLVPMVLLVSTAVTLQLAFAARAMPLKLKLVALAMSVEGVTPVQVPLTDWAPDTRILTRVSLKLILVKATGLGLDKVKVTVSMPPGNIDAALKVLAIVGASTITTRFAVFDAGPAATDSAALIPLVVLGLVPTERLVTVMVTVQLLLAGMVRPDRVIAPV